MLKRRAVPGERSLRTVVWTVGHSTRSAEEFVAVLDAYKVEALVDVRRFPGSRRLPQFGADAIERALTNSGVAYRWLPSLGGRRKSMANSINTGWRNESFRGYADHLASEEFAEGLNDLLGVAGGVRTAIMCAELLWWRCHRRLIADVLVSIGVDVVHIRDEASAEPHKIMAPARIAAGVLYYR